MVRWEISPSEIPQCTWNCQTRVHCKHGGVGERWITLSFRLRMPRNWRRNSPHETQGQKDDGRGNVHGSGADIGGVRVSRGGAKRLAAKEHTRAYRASAGK